MAEYLVKGQSPYASEELKKHAPWCDAILEKYSDINEENVEEILRHEVGMVFLQVLSDAGVYKRTEEGKEGFIRFLKAVNKM